MIRSYRAELVKLVRRRLVLITAAVTLLFGVGGAGIILAAARPAAESGLGRTPSIEQLATAGGGTQVFRVAAAFAGTFVFVVFVGAVAAEFSRGTIRTMLLRQPRRVQLLAGKLLALLTFAAVTLVVAETLTWLAAYALAPGNGIATGAWTSAAGLAAALRDFGAVLAWITGYAVLGTTLAVLLRSVPLALGVGVAWAGPIEHIIQDAWEPASRLFPGLLLEAFVAGGTAQVPAGRALLTIVAYTVVAALVASVAFAHRDVTA